jgi:hypothetical protein
MKRRIILACAVFALLISSGTQAEASRFLMEEDITCVTVGDTLISVEIDDANRLPAVHQISINNRTGLRTVNYNVSIRFTRSVSDKEGISEQENQDNGESSEINEGSIQTIQHESDAFLSYAFGLHDYSLPQTFATKYRAGSSGLKIFSVGTWFTGNRLSEGMIQVEVRAGGASIDEAVPLAAGTLHFSIPQDGENGAMYSVPLSKQADIYPDEDFYVIVTYPAGQERPQGCAMNERVETVPDRYLIKSGEGWLDLQQTDGFSNCAWIMSARGMKDDNIAWLKLHSASSGSIARGRYAYVNVRFEDFPQLKGERKAEIYITTDDPCNTNVTIPVRLHVNEAPFFRYAPKSISLPENTTQQYEIELYDNEDDHFEVSPVKGAHIAAFSVSGSKLTLTVAPRTGDTGNYSVKYRITDEHNESRDLEIPIHVTVLEQLSDPDGFVYSFMGESATYNIYDLFRYVNGDGFSFIASVENGNVIQLMQTSDSTIVVTPNDLGSTVINFILRDNYGYEFFCSIPVTVGLCEDPSHIIVQKWNSILLVNNSANNYSPEGYQWYRNREAIPEATGQYYSAGERADDLLDFTASYYVRLVTLSGDTIFTCPQTPVRKNLVAAKSYPNPVQAGETITVETGFAEEEEDVYIQLVDLSGRTVQTGSFRGVSGTFRTAKTGSGYYMLIIHGKKETKSTGIYIK